MTKKYCRDCLFFTGTDGIYYKQCSNSLNCDEYDTPEEPRTRFIFSAYEINERNNCLFYIIERNYIDFFVKERMEKKEEVQ